MASLIGQKSKNIFVTLFIGIIVVSFLFTGYESMRGSPDAIGTVGSHKVKLNEYQREIERQSQFFASIYNGGQSLSQKQIQEFGLKEQALRNLINKKLTLILSENLGGIPSSEQIKTEIKGLPYFQSNGNFDIEKYKALLSANRLTPTDFENEISEQVKTQNISAFFSTFPLSDKFMTERNTFKGQVIDGLAVEISRTQIEKMLPVTRDEIASYLADEANMKRVEAAFNERKASLDQKEEVRASHILISTETRSDSDAQKMASDLRKKVTKANFKKLADENTEDPSGKGRGGSLEWFGRGLMDPAFEKVAFEQKPGTISAPIKSSFGYHIILTEDYKSQKLATLEDHSKDIAKEFIQKNKGSESDALIKDIKDKIQFALSEGRIKTIKETADKYQLTFDDKIQLNRLEGAVGSITLQAPELSDIFANGLEQDQTYVFDRANSIVILGVRPTKDKTKELTPEAFKEDKRGLANALARKLNQEVIESLSSKTKIRIQQAMLNFY